jgi:hypothetical protein
MLLSVLGQVREGLGFYTFDEWFISDFFPESRRLLKAVFILSSYHKTILLLQLQPSNQHLRIKLLIKRWQVDV